MSKTDNSEKYRFDVTRLDGLCRDILKAIRENDGVATVSEIRDSAAVSRNELDYRLREKLTEMGVVETWQDKPAGGGQPVRHVELTAAGRDAIADGLLEDITDANANLSQLKREIEEIKNTVAEKAGEVDVEWRFDDIGTDIAELRQHVTELAESVDEIDSDYADLAERVGELEEQHEAFTNEVDDRLAEIENTHREELARLDDRIDEIDNGYADLAARLDDQANAQNAIEDRLSSLESETSKIKSETAGSIHANKMRLQSLEETHESLTNRLDETIEEINASFEEIDEEYDSETAKLNNRINNVKHTTTALKKRIEDNETKLTKNREYIHMTAEEKREYWLDRARETVEEIGCPHLPRNATKDYPRGTPRHAVLAHLPDATLRFIQNEDVFGEEVIQPALDTDGIPRKCQETWKHRWIPFYRWLSR